MPEPSARQNVSKKVPWEGCTLPLRAKNERKQIPWECSNLLREINVGKKHREWGMVNPPSAQKPMKADRYHGNAEPSLYAINLK